MTPAPHPSTLALDRHLVGVTSPEVTEHISSCARCQSYLASPGPLAPMPARIAALRPTLARRPSWRWALAASAALAAMALMSPRHDEVRSKGDPTVLLYVKHGDVVTLWHEGVAISDGDALRLEVNPATQGRVSLLQAGDGGATLSWTSELTKGGPQLLNFSMRVDEHGNREVFWVVFSDRPLTAAQLSQVGEGTVPIGTWTQRFELPKR